MPADHLAQTYELVPVTDLVEHPGNPRRSDDRAIEELIRANGFYGVLTVQASTRHVLAGNGRLRAAQRIGLAVVPVVWADVDDAEAERILLADNRASDLGGYDDAALVALLEQMDSGLAGTGYNDADQALLARHLGRSGYGSAGSSPTPEERQAAFEAADVRTVVLPYPTATYEVVARQLVDLRRQLDLGSVADVVAILVSQALGG